MGFGNWNAMPGHGRTREDSIGMVQPGYMRFGTSLNNTLLAEYADGTNQSSYRMTEGMIMESASLFPILAMLDAMQGGPPEVMPAVHLEAVDTNQLRLRWHHSRHRLMDQRAPARDPRHQQRPDHDARSRKRPGNVFPAKLAVTLTRHADVW